MRKKQTAGASNRLMRINDAIMRVCAEILRSEIKDPRVSAMVSVTKADTTKDLSYCKIYISVLGDETEKKEVLTGLKNASGFIRSAVAREINLRNTPEIKFVIDDSLEYSHKMAMLIDSADKGSNISEE